MKKVYVFFAEGFEEIEALTPIDVLMRAGFKVTLVSVSGDIIVKSTRGIGIVTDVLFEDAHLSDAHLLILPGGQPGANNLDKHEGLKKAILEANQKNILIAAICAAPQVLGHLGLLQNKNVTCYPGMEKEMKGGDCKGTAVEIAGNIITGKGVGAAMKFALTLVEILDSKEKAEKLKQQLLVE